MAPSRVFFAGWDVGVAVFLLLSFLDEIDVCEHEGFFVFVCEVNRFRACPAFLRLFDDASPPLRPTCAASRNRTPSLCCVCNHLPYILPASHARASKFLP